MIDVAASAPLMKLSAMIIGSYRHFVGRPLLLAGASEADSARWLYEDAPFCVLAHNTDPDPCFVYANRAAQRCGAAPNSTGHSAQR